MLTFIISTGGQEAQTAKFGFLGSAYSLSLFLVASAFYVKFAAAIFYTFDPAPVEP